MCFDDSSALGEMLALLAIDRADGADRSWPELRGRRGAQ
jgi:hypothetical protein